MSFFRLGMGLLFSGIVSMGILFSQSYAAINTNIMDEGGGGVSTSYIDFQVNNCTIPLGESRCAGTVYLKAPAGKIYNMTNFTRGFTTSNIINPNRYTTFPGSATLGYIVTTSTLGDAANYLKEGINDLGLNQWNTTIAKATATGICATGSAWNGQACMKITPVLPSIGPIMCTMEARLCTDGSTMPRNPNTCEWIPGQCPSPTTPITPPEKIAGCVLSSSSQIRLLSNGNYDAVSLGSSSQTLGLRTRNSCISACDDVVRNFSGTRMNCFWDSTIVKEYVGSTPPPTTSLSISCSKSSYTLGEAISCKIRGGSGIKTCWQTGTSSVTDKNCVDYRWVPDANGIDLSYNSTVTSAIIGNYTLYTRDVTGKVASTQVSYTNGNTLSLPRMDVKSCTIASGKGTCAATVDVTAEPGKLFNLENTTRGMTSTNIFRPGVYTITTSFLGDAANYITFGVNNLILKEGNIAVAKASTNAVCASGTTWNGQVCAGNSTTTNYYVTIEAKNCIIPIGKGTCPSTISVTSTKYIGTTGGRTFSLSNLTRNLTTTNLFTPNNATITPGSYPVYNVSTNASGDAANYATNGVNNLSLIEGDTIVAKATMTATCATGSTWNGQVCSPTGGIACLDVVRMCEDGSAMPRDPKSCSFLPEQCPKDYPTDPKVPAPLLISCSKSSYSLGEEVSCKISGGVGTKMCWQRGTANTEPKDCTQVGWVADGNELYFYRGVSSSMLGEYALYVKDTLGKIVSTKVQYNANQPGLDPAPTYIDFQANNCTIPLGKNKCASSLFVKAPADKFFTVVNLNRGFTSTNLLNPKTYASIPGSSSLVYTVSESPMGDAANYITYGESNNLNLLENNNVVARAIASAKCADGTTWDGKSCINSGVVPVPPVVCSKEARMCENGSVMPRDMKSCKWLPEKCPPIPEPPIPAPPPTPTPTPTPPPLPPSDITIAISSIGGVALNGGNSIQFSKSPISPLTAEGKINKTGGSYTIRLSSNTSKFFMDMPVSPNGVWSSTNTNTPTMYRSRIVTQGENLLTFSLLDAKTKTPVSQIEIKAYVSITRGGIIIDPPICMMADGTKGYCANPPIIPPYPNCPKTSISSTTAGTSLVYCPTDVVQEINPQNTINPKKPPVTTLPPVRGTGAIVQPETPTLPPNCGTKTSAGTSSSLIYCPTESEIVIKDTITDLAPIEDVLDSNSRRRIDIIITRTKTRISTMGYTEGINFINTSISRIQSIPNKTVKAKLIDTYTIAKLEALKSGLQSASANNDSDYIGLIDNLLAR